MVSENLSPIYGMSDPSDISFYPVHNVGTKGTGNSSKYWEEIPDMQRMLLNAFGLSNTEPFFLRRILEKGLHGIYNKNMTFFIDSGGFQNRENVKTNNPLDVLRFQEKIGADIASTLDIPIMSNTPVHSSAHQEYTSITIKNALLALKNREREDMQLYASIQGHNQTHILNCIDYLKKHGDFDGFALGGLLPKRSRFKELIDLIYAVRKKIGDKPLHLFGIGGPGTIPLLIYIGANSFDSSAFMVAGSNRVLYTAEKGSVKFGDLPENCKYMPCVCPVCSTHTVDEIRNSRRLIATHNLWMLTYEIRKIKQHILEGDFESYLNLKFQTNPVILDAYKYAKLKVRGLV